MLLGNCGVFILGDNLIFAIVFFFAPRPPPDKILEFIVEGHDIVSWIIGGVLNHGGVKILVNSLIGFLPWPMETSSFNGAIRSDVGDGQCFVSN